MDFRDALYTLSRNVHELGSKHSSLGGVHVWKGWRNCDCQLAKEIQQLEESRLKIYSDMNDLEAENKA